MLTDKEKREVIRDYGLSESDTGSLEVQIALLDANMKKLRMHIHENPNDQHVRNGYRKMKKQRSDCLRSLKKLDEERYMMFKMKRGLLEYV